MRLTDIDQEIITILKNDKKRQHPPNTPCVSEYQYDKIPGKKPGEPAFGALFVGSTGQGKTFMIKKLLNDPNFYGKAPNGNRPGTFFDILIIISSSIDVEDEYDDFEEGTRVIKRKPDEFQDVMESIKSQQERFHRSKKDRPRMPRICLILDDCIHLKIFGYNNGNGGLAEWMYAVGRHYLIYPWITTQYLKAVSPIIRNNVKLLLLFKVFELAELEKFIDVLVPKVDRERMRERMYEAWNVKYTFLAVLSDRIYSEKFYINLKEPALQDHEEDEEYSESEEEEDPSAKRVKKE